MAYQRTEDGILVPEHVMEEKRAEERTTTRWLWADWQGLRRWLQRMKQKEKITVSFTCDVCKSELTLVDVSGNTKAARCNCTDRTFTQGV